MHRSHTHSDHLSWAQIRQRGVSQDCRSVSGEKIGLNEANLINDVERSLDNIFL